MGVRVIISDFGGVLTNPLEEAFLAYAEVSRRLVQADTRNPAWVLEMAYALEDALPWADRWPAHSAVTL